MASNSSLPLMIALITCPALLATNEAIRQGQQKDRKEAHRGNRCNITGFQGTANPEVDADARAFVSHLANMDMGVIQLYINTGLTSGPGSVGHPFTGYYLPYPDTKYEGLVSSIADTTPPVMNWIYVDRTTHEVKYGVRADAQPNVTGPFDCTKQDHRLTLEGWEGFAAVDEGDGEWALYFDFDDDGLRSKLGEHRMVLDVELLRTEKKLPKPSQS